MRKTFIALFTLSALALAACGEETPPPATPPPPPPVESPPPIATAAPTDTAPPPAPKPSMADLQATAIKAVTDAINAHDAQKYAAVFAADGVSKEPGMPDAVGRDAIAASVAPWFTGFPDAKFGVTRTFAKDNVLVSTWAWTGTDTGGFMGKKPTNRPAGTEGVAIAWYNDDGSIKEVHLIDDPGTIAAQLDAKAKKGSFRAPPTLPSAPETYTAAGTPDEDKNLALAKAMYQALDDKKKADVDSLVTDDTTLEDYSGPMTYKGLKGWSDMYKTYTTAFPDFKQVPLSNIWAVKDFVIAEGVLTGTHKGKLGPIRATNKPVSIHFVDISQWKDGKIAHLWTWANSFELLTEIGVMKPPGAAAAKPGTDKGSDTGKKGAAGDKGGGGGGDKKGGTGDKGANGGAKP